MAVLAINRRQYLELEKLVLGAFAPLRGFMTEEECLAVAWNMHLPGGALFPLPVVLDVTAEQAQALRGTGSLHLTFGGRHVGEIDVRSVYRCDKAAVAQQIYGTADPAHPGVEHFFRMGEYFVGGPVRLLQRTRFEFSKFELTPQETRTYFSKRGWRTVVGFQTRNVPHRAHEYLLRFALEFADGLFVQPLVGLKKQGDYTPQAILTAYETLIDRFLPKERVLLGVLSTAMRYAGPREAVFHAIIRRNYGCTHFIVGRDHAGVGGYYTAYEAQELTRKLNGQLGIEILRLHGPFSCRRCGGIVTDQSCPHSVTEPAHVRHISGTEVRASLSQYGTVADELMRPEIVASLSHVPLFIQENGE